MQLYAQLKNSIRTEFGTNCEQNNPFKLKKKSLHYPEQPCVMKTACKNRQKFLNVCNYNITNENVRIISLSSSH